MAALTFVYTPPKSTPQQYAQDDALAENLNGMKPGTITGAYQASLKALGQPMSVMAGVAPPPATPKNPTAGRTVLGMPVADVAVGAVAVIGLGWLAKARHWIK